MSVCIKMSGVCREKGDIPKARAWLYKGIEVSPDIREPYYEMAKLGYAQQDWPLVYLMVEKALAVTEKTNKDYKDTEAWGHRIYDLGAICCFHLHLYEKSCRYAQAAYDMDRSNERLYKNLESIKKHLMKRDILL